MFPIFFIILKSSGYVKIIVKFPIAVNELICAALRPLTTVKKIVLIATQNNKSLEIPENIGYILLLNSTFLLYSTSFIITL